VRQAGRKAADVVRDYVAVEAEFRKHPIGGAIYAWRGMGSSPEAIEQMLKQVLAGMQAPAVPSENVPPPAPAIDTLSAKIELFADDPRNEFMDIVGPRMREIMAGDPTLKMYDAYNFACHESPHVKEILTMRNRPRPQVARTPVERAQQQAKATIGAPRQMSDKQRDVGGESVYDTVRRVYDQQRERG
jgi:hypothetical protein